MAKKTIKAQMKQRRDTKANWASTNPVLLDGELGIVSDDPNLYKVGDGTTAWNALPFRGFDGTLAQDTGTSPNSAISQKGATDAFSSIIGLDYFVKKMYALRTDGNVKASVEGLDTTEFLPISGRSDITLVGGFTNLNSSIVPLAFYDENQKFISYVTGDQKGFTIQASDIPSNARYIRCTAYTTENAPLLKGCSLGNIWNALNTAFVTKGILPTGTDLNDVQINGAYLLTSDYSYANNPFGTAFLWVTSVNTFTLQIIFNFSGKLIKKRRRSGSTWEAWQDITTNDTFLTIEATSLDSVDLNAVTGNYVYLLDDSHTYENLPYNGAIGFLRTSTPGAYTLQEFYPFSGNDLYKRRGKKGGTWTSWGKITGDAGAINQYPIYNNTYEITASPDITVDTSHTLVASGNTADRSADIVTLLQTTGVCRLGAGTFYVADISMPDNTMIIGSGPATKLVLTASAKYAIKLAKNCSVKDLHIMGSLTSITVGENIAERHGILWSGDYSSSQSNAKQPQRGQIENLWISSLTGGGITCYNTGYGTICHLEACNINIWNCAAGINISYWSEFHKFTNVRCGECHYGCINNGGNNVFVNCDFSSNGVGFLMDNTNEKSPNNSHGSAIGCVFNHTASNKGVGIHIINCNNGYIFTGCQIFYSQIIIENSAGIAVTNTNFGKSNCDIKVTGEGSVLFANNMFQDAPVISKTTQTKFVACYSRTGEEIQ